MSAASEFLRFHAADGASSRTSRAGTWPTPPDTPPGHDQLAPFAV